MNQVKHTSNRSILPKALVLLVAAFLAVSSCIPLEAATFINIGTGTTGGTYYPVGASMAKYGTRTSRI